MSAIANMGWDANTWTQIAKHATLMAARLKKKERHCSDQTLNLTDETTSRMITNLHRPSLMNRSEADQIIEPACKPVDPVEKLRQYDRQKKRKVRNVTNDLKRQLDSLLPRTEKQRTLHETLADAAFHIRNGVTPANLRRGMMLQEKIGLILVDPDLTILDFSQSAREILKCEIRTDTRLYCMAAEESTKRLKMVFRNLCRGSFRNQTLCRFVLSNHYTGSVATSNVMSEVIRCGDAQEDRLNMVRGKSTSNKFMIMLHPTCPFPLDSTTCVVTALRSMMGFQPEETFVMLYYAEASAHWDSRGTTCDFPWDFAPFVEFWVIDLLLRGIGFGDWGELAEHLASRSDLHDEDRHAAGVMTQLSAFAEDSQADAPAAGRQAAGDFAMEVIQESGSMLCRTLIRGLCLFEFRLSDRGIVPIFPFLRSPTMQQPAAADGSGLEELAHARAAAGQATVQLLADGGLWFSGSQSIGNEFQPSCACENSNRGTDSLRDVQCEVNVVMSRDPDGALAVRKSKVLGGDIESSIRRWVRAEPASKTQVDSRACPINGCPQSLAGIQNFSAVLDADSRMRCTGGLHPFSAAATACQNSLAVDSTQVRNCPNDLNSPKSAGNSVFSYDCPASLLQVTSGPEPADTGSSVELLSVLPEDGWLWSVPGTPLPFTHSAACGKVIKSESVAYGVVEDTGATTKEICDAAASHSAKAEAWSEEPLQVGSPRLVARVNSNCAEEVLGEVDGEGMDQTWEWPPSTPLDMLRSSSFDLFLK